MKNRGGKLSGFAVVLGVLFVVAVAHTALHVHFYGAKSVLGFAFAGSESESQNPASNTLSFVFMVTEWVAMVFVMLAGRISNRRKSAAEIKMIIDDKKNASSSAKTDLDVLYDILNHKKELGISEIASAFNVTKDIASEWAQMLEESNLAEIEYSNLGEPVVKIK
jgi:predicted transcriptional regulator